MANKSIAKSVRMTNEVYKYVDSFNGNGFNEKFENLVLFCLKEEKKLMERVKEQKKTYEYNEKRISAQQQILNSLHQISVSVQNLLNMSYASEVSAKGVQLKMRETEKSDLEPA